MNYVFRYVGKDPAIQNENRFFYKVDNGMVYTVRGAMHAPMFDDGLIDIQAMGKKLGPAYSAELWTPALRDEDFYKTAPKGWWIAPLIFCALLLGALLLWEWAVYHDHKQPELSPAKPPIGLVLPVRFCWK